MQDLVVCFSKRLTCGVMQPLRVELPLHGLQLSVGLIQRLFPPPRSGVVTGWMARGFTSGLGSVLAMMLWDDDCAGCAAVLGVCLLVSPPDQDCQPAQASLASQLAQLVALWDSMAVRFFFSGETHLIAAGHSESC